MKHLIDNRGFTLIELLLVMVIMGIMLAVIVPRAWRANVDSKYTLVRQNCSELASFASSWGEQNIIAQDDSCGTTLFNYYSSLTGWTNNGISTSWTYGMWVASGASCNWNSRAGQLRPFNRTIDGHAAPPESSVEDLVDPSKMPRNPFNGASIFVAANDPNTSGHAIPGAICCAGRAESSGEYVYFALIFQGTDSSGKGPKTGGSSMNGTAKAFYAGQDGTLAGLRNGVFLARLN